MARTLYEHTAALPIVSPHGHVSAASFATDAALVDAAVELVVPDHYLLRMLYSQGIPLEELGIRPRDGRPYERDSRTIWRTFAAHYHLFRGTPSRLWLDHTMAEVFGIEARLDANSADAVFDEIGDRLADEKFRPRALVERFGIDFLAATDGALDSLGSHEAMRASGWSGRVVPTFRPDDVVDPDRPDFAANLDSLAEITGEDTTSWNGYLAALRSRRSVFIQFGATATDHGHPTASTANLPAVEAESLFAWVRSGGADPDDAELFRAQMLTEMAAMSIDDGLVMQLHAGSWRGHNPSVAARFGPDKGADIPTRISYVDSLKPLLDRFGNDRALTLVIYTLDESTYARELAPLAGHYPALRLGPPSGASSRA